MKILCVNNAYIVTKGKWYESEEEHETNKYYMLAEDDFGISDISNKENFITIYEYRNNLIDEILNI